MALTQIVVGLIGLVIGILILTSLGNTVVEQTETRACGTFLSASENLSDCSLENSSETGKTMYSLIELIYPIIGVMIMIVAGFALKNKFD